MIVWTHDRWRFPLPEHNRFPIEKYTLLRERVEAEGVEVREAEPVPWEWLEAVHEPALIERIRTGGLSVREERGLGMPWSEALVERGRRSVGGTVAAAGLALERGLGMNLGGGTHHAGRDFARGYCLFNDVAVALSACAPRAACGARWSSTATSTRATAPPTCSAATRSASRCRCTAPATTRSSASPPTSTSTSRAARATTTT